MPSAPSEHATDDSTKSTAQLTTQLAHQVAALVHDELALTRAEMTKKGKRAGGSAGLLGASGLLAMTAFVCLTGCVVAALALALPVWAAALIVGGAYLVFAGAFALTGRKGLARAVPPVPTESIEHVKEDVQWIKAEATSKTP